MHRLQRYILIILLSSIMSGCAYTTDKLSLKPLSSQPVTAATKAQSHKPITVGEVLDERGVENPYIVIRKENGDGAASGAYELEQPVAAVFERMLKK